jgi:hypothetical protein
MIASAEASRTVLLRDVLTGADGDSDALRLLP